MSERYLEDYVVGQKFGSGRIRVEKDRIKALCRLIRPAAFHLDKALASGTVFRGLAASGWHTVAMPMRLLVGGELKPAGGIVGTGLDDRWPGQARPGDALHLECEILEVRPSKSRTDQGLI
jgi:acyl dehydratase